jgi:hypothetical protein
MKWYVCGTNGAALPRIPHPTMQLYARPWSKADLLFLMDSLQHEMPLAVWRDSYAEKDSGLGGSRSCERAANILGTCRRRTRRRLKPQQSPSSISTRSIASGWP